MLVFCVGVFVFVLGWSSLLGLDGMEMGWRWDAHIGRFFFFWACTYYYQSQRIVC